MSGPVEQKLGNATGRLYDAVTRMMGSCEGTPTHAALSRLALATLCGAYHDYRAGAPNPKGDLVEALRAVQSHSQVDVPRAALLLRVLAGDFADGEAARWVVRGPRNGGAAVALEPVALPVAVELIEKEHRVFTWLYRFVEVYGFGPTLREIARGLHWGAPWEIDELEVGRLLRQIERKGAVVGLGGVRGWLPTRAP